MTPFGKRIELRAVADSAEKSLRIVGRQPSTRTSPHVGRIKPVIRFISVVLPEPFGPTRLVIPGGIDKVDTIYAEHIAIELADVAELDCLLSGVDLLAASRFAASLGCGYHDTTSFARSRRFSSPMQAAQTTPRTSHAMYCGNLIAAPDVEHFPEERACGSEAAASSPR